MIKNSIIYKVVIYSILSVIFFSCYTQQKPHELQSHYYVPVPGPDQELNYFSGYRFVHSDKDKSSVGMALNFMNEEFYMSLFVQNHDTKAVTVDYPDISIINQDGKKLSYYTDSQFLQDKADMIMRNQTQAQYAMAYINNELNEGRLYLAQDYVTNNPSDRKQFDDLIDYYSENIFRPSTLRQDEYTLGYVYLMNYSDEMNFDITIGSEVHSFKFVLK